MNYTTHRMAPVRTLYMAKRRQGRMTISLFQFIFNLVHGQALMWVEGYVFTVDDGVTGANTVPKPFIYNRSLFSTAVSMASAAISPCRLQFHLAHSVSFLAMRPVWSLQQAHSSATTRPHFSPSTPTITAPTPLEGGTQG